MWDAGAAVGEPREGAAISKQPGTKTGMSTGPSSGTGALTAGAAEPAKVLSPELQKQLSRVTELASLPEITAKIVEVVDNPRATAVDMHAIVRNDPALATKILKVVNSAFYGLPSQVASLDRAIVLLGLSTVKNIALAMSLARLVRGEPFTAQFGPRDLWRHSIAVGVCACALAKSARSLHAEEYFAAGLVHDMGLLVTGQLFAGKLKTVIERMLAGAEDFCAVERELIGANHESIGLALATKWRFPPGLRYAVGYHHDPEGLQPEFRKIVSLIQVADTVCAGMEHGFYLTARRQEVTPELLAAAQLSRTAVEEVAGELPGKIAEAEQILG
jgi:HD-like signal output (HDOD) protein